MDDKETKLKQTKNLFNALTRNENRIFYSADRIRRNLLIKARKCYYPRYGFSKLVQ